MLLWLPPSEGKSSPTGKSQLELDKLSFPSLTEARQTVAAALIEVSSAPNGAAILGLGKKAATDLGSNLDLFTGPTAKALEVYTGVLYTQLDAATLSADACSRLMENTWIFSGLFGVVKPGDLIPDHRLAMGVRLPPLGALSAWWKPHLTNGLDDVGEEPVVDLRSGVYRSPFPGDLTQRVEIQAVQTRDGKRTTISHYAKLWRGRAARHLLETAPENATLQDVLEVLGNWRDASRLADVEVEATKATRVGGSTTRVTLVLAASQS